MNKLIVIFALLLLISCSRYKYIPRAKTQNKIAFHVTDSRSTIETAIVEQNLENVILAKKPSTVNPPNYEPQAPNNIELGKVKKEKINSISKLEKSDTVKSHLKNSKATNRKYEKINELILGSVALTLIGLMLVLEANILGYLVIALGLFLLIIFLIGLLFISLFDKLGKKKPTPTHKNAPVNEPKKEKTKKNFDKVNYIFINLLISNFIVWIIVNLRIKK